MTIEEARHTYHNLLCSKLSNYDFYVKIAYLLENQPLFFPAYHEMLWNAKERGDEILYQKIHHEMVAQINKFVNSSSRITLHQTEHDNLVTELQTWSAKLHRFSGLKLKSLALIKRVKQAVKIEPDPKREPKHLRLMGKYDIHELKQEMIDAASYWWQLDTSRRSRVIEHQHTWSVRLRKRSYQGESPYRPVSGTHESTPLSCVNRFAKTHNFILKLAEDLKVGLGGVAIVQMEPGKQAYRHFDSELELRGRNRFHLVLCCGQNNLLSCGNEDVVVNEGELWFFDNKVMHRAYNGSYQPRTHVIFDGYPLDHECIGLS